MREISEVILWYNIGAEIQHRVKHRPGLWIDGSFLKNHSPLGLQQEDDPQPKKKKKIHCLRSFLQIVHLMVTTINSSYYDFESYQSIGNKIPIH